MNCRAIKSQNPQVREEIPPPVKTQKTTEKTVNPQVTEEVPPPVKKQKTTEKTVNPQVTEEVPPPVKKANPEVLINATWHFPAQSRYA